MDILITGTLFLAFGFLLGFWINAKQLALMALAAALFMFAGAMGAGQGAARSILFVATASVFLQLGYFLVLLGQAMLVSRRRSAKRFASPRKQGPDG